MQSLQIIRGNNAAATYPIPDGIAGNSAALAQMALMVRRDAHDENLRNWVLQNVIFPNRVAGHDVAGEINACLAYCRDQIRYTRDPVDLERIADAWTTIETRAGDCKSKSVLLATMLAILGREPFFMVLSQEPYTRSPQWQFGHVYVGVMFPPGTFLPLDPTPETSKPGWQGEAFVRMRWNIFGE